MLCLDAPYGPLLRDPAERERIANLSQAVVLLLEEQVAEEARRQASSYPSLPQSYCAQRCEEILKVLFTRWALFSRVQLSTVSALLRPIQEELARSKEEARGLEAAISAREAELAARRAEIAARLRETHAACGEANELAAQLRAQAAQRNALREEAARLRARLQERGALHLHSELVALRRAAAAGAAAQSARLEDARRRRIEYQAELRGLSVELESLRQHVAAGLAAKAQAEGVLLNLTTELVSASAQVERSRALAARRVE